MTGQIFLKLIAAVFFVLAIALGAVDLLALRSVESSYVDALANQLANKCEMLAVLSGEQIVSFTGETIGRVAQAAAGRVTVVARDGHVIADSEADPAHMENHGLRPEIRAALDGRRGVSRRHSGTVGVDFMYVAVPIPAGALRLAVPTSEVDRQVSVVRWKMLGATAIAFLPAVIVAAFLARMLSNRLAAIISHASRLAAGDFGARLESRGTHELAILTNKLNETSEKLQRMFNELEREHSELAKLERVRKDFVINVSHELRTPLASIQGYAETLLDGAIHDSRNNVRFLDIIRQNAERLTRLTADLLTLSRVELRSQKFQFAAYYANRLLADLVDVMQPIAGRKEIKVVMEPAPDGTEVICDSEAVAQILSNLLDNAIKYTPEGGSIVAGARALGELEVEFYVRDTGMGIPADEQARLFERFYRVDKARSRQLGGTGLGLAIVKHLVLAQGGTVRVESEVGRGSLFAFTLPVHDLGLGEEGAISDAALGEPQG
jgi:two-component system, OmpR family, phosphate regulon sensor histidine kinase PhoR